MNRSTRWQKQKDPFALSIEKACTIYDEGGYKKVNDKWTEYVGQLKKFVKDSTMNGQMDLDAQKNLAMGMINEVEIGSKQAAEELQDAYREMEKYKDMVVKRSEILQEPLRIRSLRQRTTLSRRKTAASDGDIFKR